jgi:VanZ family protein
MRALDSLHINDKFEHLAAYAVLAFLPAIHERRPFVAYTAVGLAALGVALEFGQLATGWRDFEVGDMIADALGVCAGVAVGIAVRRIEMVRALLPHE